MEGQKDPITVSVQADARVVEFLVDKLLDEVNISRIGEQLDLLIARDDPPRLVLDFANVMYMSSSALGMLITLHRKIREQDGRMVLCNVRPEIYKVFSITKLSEVFQIYDSRTTAMAGLA